MFKSYYYDETSFIVPKSFCKMTFCNLITSFIFIPLLVLIILTSNSINDYGLAIDGIHATLPWNISALRAWFLFLLILYFFVNSFIIDNAIVYIRNTHQKVLAILSCFFPFIFFALLLKGHHYEYFSQYSAYLRTYRDEPEQISHFEFFMWLTRRAYFSKIVRNTLLFYLTFAFFIVGLGFIFSDYDDHKVSNNYFIFNTLSFFTQQTNFLCFVFLLLFCFFAKRNLFRNNTWMIIMTSYILIVGIVANIMIGPYVSIDNNIKEYQQAYPIVKFIWFHVLDPIMFTWFAINSMAQSYSRPIRYRVYLSNYLRYPLFYGIYLYSVPFLCRYSIYGQLTNLNPNMYTELVTSGGKPVWILGGIGILILFIAIGSLIRYISIKMNRNYDVFKQS